MNRTLADDFRRFLGSVPAGVALILSLVLGAPSVALLRSREWGAVDVLDWSQRGTIEAVVAAIGFTIVALVADRTIGFPGDINVEWPNAFVVYPTMAVIAEVLFHLVPLSLLVVVFGLEFDHVVGPQTVMCLVLVALVETTYQVRASRRVGSRAALIAFVGVHLFVLGFAQMGLLWRFGLAAMLLFRLVYYLGWHIVLGRLRLADR